MVVGLEVETAVGEIKALVAEGKVRNLLVAQRDRESEPVVKGRIHHLIGSEPARSIGQRNVANLSPPALDQRNRQVIWA